MRETSTEPQVTARLPYLPALDVLRGLAVGLVLLQHGGVAQARGGYLGVTVFFTLSGFLITSLLLVEHGRSGRISLRAFWARRARRLVPGVLLCFPLVAVVVAASSQHAGRGLVGDAVAAALWVANWRFVFAHQSYADLFSLPSPFQHFWSLAVEEQYYLVFPVLAAVLLRRGGRRALALVAGQLLVVSAALGVVLTAHGASISRAYYGTDTRIAEILVGVLLALALVQRDGIRPVGRSAQRGLDAGATLALVVLGVMVTNLPYGDERMFRGGLLVAAGCSALVIAAVVQPQSRLGRTITFAPLQFLGIVSYGVYLFHWPIFLLLTAQRTGLHGPQLLAARCAVTLVAATLSYVLVETPVRSGRPFAGRPGAAFSAWLTGATSGVLVVAMAAGVILLPDLHPARPPVTVANGTAPNPGAGAQLPAGGVASTTTITRSSQAPGSGPQPPPSQRAGRTRGRSQPAPLPEDLTGGDRDYTQPPPPPDVPPGALRVLVVGDSVGNNLGRGLVAWAADRSDVAVYNLAIPACPVSRGVDRRLDAGHEFPVKPWCDWWSDTSSPRYAAAQRFAPDVVLVEDGINATFERRLPSWSGWEGPGQPQFDDWMVSEYQAFVDALNRSGATTVVANAPCADWQRLFPWFTDGDRRVRDLDTVDYPRIVGARSADLFDEVCPNGQYSDTVDGVNDARPDGFHFTDEAAEALARDWLGPLLIQAHNGPLGGVAG